MQVSYGPPGLKGVSQLMAVGADDLEASSTDRAVNVGLAVAAGVFVLGLAIKRPTPRHWALGAAAALLGVKAVRGGFGKTVTVAATTTVSGW